MAKRHSFSLVPAALLAMAIAGCGGSSQEDREDTSLDIAGTFNERYNCAEGGSCVDEDVVFTIIIGAGQPTSEGDILHTFHNPDTAWSGSGTLCNSTFTWTASTSGYSESGVWVFSDADNFEKSSSYTSGEGGAGACTGAGARVGAGDPGPPAPIGDCP
jgi:hypothetical protein